MRRLALSSLLLVTLLAPTTAEASQLIARDAQNVMLQVDSQGQALVGYRAKGKTWSVLAWGAVNALHPTADRAQIRFKLDYAGGRGKYRKTLSRGFKNACRPYAGPPLAWFVTGCTMPDGSHWALQAWQRGLPNLGLDPWKPLQASNELRLSHWSTDLPKLEVWGDWAYSKRFDHLFGRYTYLGQPVFGFNVSSTGAPSDGYGRNIYVDTLDSAYGPGWKRENSFLAHKGTGVFCYGLYEHNPYPATRPGAGRPAKASGTARLPSGPASCPTSRGKGPLRARTTPKSTSSSPRSSARCTARMRSASPCSA